MADIDLNQARSITTQKEEQYGLPAGTLFKIGGIESRFQGGLTSPKGAEGYFQFMPATAKAYGLTDPNNFEQAADAAGRYMRDNLKRYNGNMNLALADYNGGPKAVDALARGKPFAETEAYLKKFHGESYTPLSGQFMTGQSTPGGASYSASELFKQQQQQDSQYGGFVNNVSNLPTAVATGFKLDNSVYNWWQEQAVTKHTDPNFQWTEDLSKEILQGIPQKNWEYVLQAKSRQEAEDRRARTMKAMEQEQELAKMGVAGFTGRLVGGLADLPTLIAFVPGMGGEGLLTASSRIANAVRMGLVGAGTNVAFDAATMGNRPLGTYDDLYISGMMGLGLGAIGGSMANLERVALSQEMRQLREFGLRESKNAQLAEFKSRGLDLTDEGRKVFNLDAYAAKAEKDVTELIDRQSALIQAKYKVETTPEDFSGLPRSGTEFGTGKGVDLSTKIREEEGDVPTFKKSAALDRGDKRGTVTAASEHLSKLLNDADPLVASLARRLSEQLRDDVAVVTRNKPIRAYYDPSRHEIHISPNEKPWVQLHEIAHAVTANKLKYGLANPNTAHGALASELQDIYKQVKQAAKSEKFDDYKTSYYLKNMDEFMAGIYSGKSEFIDFLSRTQVKGESVLTKIVDVIRQILGMKPDEVNALTRSLSVIDRMVDEPLQVRQTLKDKRGVTTKKMDYLMSPMEEDAAAAKAADVGPVYGIGLGTENILGGEKAPQLVRNLSAKLIGTTIGYKDHSVVKAHTWDDTVKWAEGWAVEMRKGSYPAFEEWFKASGRKWHEKGQAFEEFGSEVSRYIRGVEKDYPPEVVKAGEAMRKTLAKVVDYINNPLLDEGGSKRGLTMQEIRDPETGVVTLEGGLDKNPNYLPRKHDVNKWNSLVQTYGRDAVEGWWARAHQAGREGVSDEQAARFGKWYVRTVEEAHANRTQDLLDNLLRGQDREALKASLMNNGGYSEAEAMKVIEDMFPTKATDTGRTMASLKHRNTINEKYTETWTTRDGQQVEVGLDHFVHTNAFDIVEPYLRRTAGSVAMAKHLDVYKVGDIDRLIAEVTENKLGNEFKSKADVQRYRDTLKFVFDRIQGLPQEEFSKFNKSMEMWRNFNVIRLMGGAVWNQAAEMGNVLGSMGYKAVAQAIPEIKSLTRDIKTGKAPNEILEHLENTIGGAGADYISRMEFGAKDDWVRNLGDTKMNRWLDSVDTGMRKMSKGVLDYTGMTPLMIQQKRVHAVALVNHFVNTANGKPSTFLTKDRLAWMGMDEAMTQRVMDNLKKYSKPTKGEFSQTHKLDINRWIKEDPEAHSAFMNAIHRESRRVIQENDLASMIPLMGTTLGKTVFQFMNFSMHGWNKSLMFAANHRDWTTTSTVLHSSMLASLAYMGRTMAGSVGMDSDKQREYLEKRMAPGQIVANSFGRIAQVSLLPNLYDTLSPYPLFSGMRTTSDLSSLASNPTYQAINGVISLKKIVRNATSDEYQTTERDIRTWGKLLPLNNIQPISTLLNAIANDYPTTEKEQ